MKGLWQWATGLVRDRLFLKYILATIVIGGALNAIVLVSYFEIRREAQTNQIAAEIATLANKIGLPASKLASAGETSRARIPPGCFLQLSIRDLRRSADRGGDACSGLASAGM